MSTSMTGAPKCWWCFCRFSRSRYRWEWNQAKLHDLKVIDGRPAARIPAQTNQLSDQTGAVHPNPNRKCWSRAKIIRPKVSFGSASVFYPKQRGKCHSCSAPNTQLFVYTYENPNFGRCSYLMCISSGCTCERCFFPQNLEWGIWTQPLPYCPVFLFKMYIQVPYRTM